MYKCTILLLVLPMKIFAALEPLIAMKDPFAHPEIHSCEKVASIFLSKLNLWQYKGYLIPLTNHTIKNASIWLKNDKQWQNLDNRTMTKFSPWQIITVSPEAVIWQVDLPDYCEKKLVFTMEFQRD